MPNPSEFVLTFLQSVGRRQEADYYLRLFRDQPKPSFAVIAAEPAVFDQAPGAVIEPLRFLSDLGLYPILAMGLLGPTQSVTVGELCEWIADEGLQVERFAHSDSQLEARVRATLEREVGVVLDLPHPTLAERFSALGRLLATLNTRKLVLLRSAGGLGPKEAGHVALTPTHLLDTQESGISVINLRTDFDSLQAEVILSVAERELLTQIKAMHEVAPQLQTSVASPLNLLRELFTVKGAGTLVKTGSSILRAADYHEVVLARLTEVLETTFAKKLHADFFTRPVLNIYFEAAYRGAAIVQKGIQEPGLTAAYLTKFAVDKHAQGEGIGRDLWEAMLREHPVVYWRARANNPISAWYQAECDGMHTQGAWRVYWRGVPADSLPAAISDAMQRPVDFEETSV